MIDIFERWKGCVDIKFEKQKKCEPQNWFAFLSCISTLTNEIRNYTDSSINSPRR